MYFSPKTSADGLVFHYDTGNTVRSYLGEPTTNLVNPNWSPWSVDGSGQGSIGTRTLLSAYHCRIVDISANTRQYIFTEGISANTQYTFSVKFLKISGTPTLRFQIQSYNGDTFINAWFPTTVQIGVADIEGWQTAKYTVTTPANTTRILWFMQDGDDYTAYTHSFELKEPQIEAKSHATPFVAGTRSATQGLKDLTARNTVNLSNVSFDSNAQMVFDGSNDYISLADGTRWFTNEWTYEMVVKFNGNTGTYQGLLWGEGDTGGGSGLQKLLTFYNYSYFHYRINNAVTGWADTNFTPTGFTPTRYNHLAWQFNNGVTNLYINGALAHTNNVRGAYSGGTNSPLYIGCRNDIAYVFNGEMPMLKRYSRALTADEVARNFNAIKSRFNIG